MAKIERRIRRIRRRALRWIGRRVDVELFDGRDFEAVIVSVGRNTILFRGRRRGRIVERRIRIRDIEDIDLD